MQYGAQKKLAKKNSVNLEFRQFSYFFFQNTREEKVGIGVTSQCKVAAGRAIHAWQLRGYNRLLISVRVLHTVGMLATYWRDCGAQCYWLNYLWLNSLHLLLELSEFCIGWIVFGINVRPRCKTFRIYEKFCFVFESERKWQRPWFTRSTKGWTVLHLQCIKYDLNCIEAVFHKWYKESNKHLSFGKNFQRW